MTFGKQIWQSLAAVVLGALVSSSAMGGVVTRLVTAGGAATSATIAPGGTVSIDVRLDITLPLSVSPQCTVGVGTCPATGIIGTAFRLTQTTPVANGFFSITGRSFVGSPFNDTTSGTSDAIVLTAPSNLLDPSNNDNLGRSTIGLAPVLPAANILAANLTLTASAATPPGVYTIKALSGVSFATDDGFVDYDMSGPTFTITVSAAPPAFSKAFAPTSVIVNGTSTLSFTINNPNTSPLTGVGFTDTLPAGVVVNTPNGLVGSCGGGTITATAGASSVTLAGATLPASSSCNFSVTVKATTIGVKNNVTGPIQSVEGGIGGTASATLTVAAIVPPTISKAFAPTGIPVGGTSTLSFTINNPNAAQLTGVGVTDTLPAGVIVATPNGLTGSCGGGTITATAGASSITLAGATLAANATCNFSVNVTATSLGAKNNVTGPVQSVEGGPGNTASATLNVAPVQPAAISKAFAPTSIIVNGTSVLSFTINNPNPSSLTGVGFTDTLPAGVVVSTPNGLVGTCGGGTITATAGSGSVTLAGATLAGNASCNFSVNVTGTTVGAKNNVTGAVTSVEGGPGNTASATLTVSAVAPPTIAKSFGAPIPAIGGQTSLSFVLSNPNPSGTLTGIGFTDTLPAGLVVSTPNGLSGTCGGGVITAVAGSGTVTLAGATLAAGASCNFSVNVTATSLGTKTNTTGAVTSVEGGTGATTTAVLNVGVLTPVPTLSQWAVWLLGLLMLIVAGMKLYSRRKA